MINSSKNGLTRRDATKTAGAMALVVGLGSVVQPVPGRAATYGPSSPLRQETAKLVNSASGAIVNNEVLENQPLVWNTTTEPFEFAPGVYVIPGPVLNAAFIVTDLPRSLMSSHEVVQAESRTRELADQCPDLV